MVQILPNSSFNSSLCSVTVINLPLESRSLLYSELKTRRVSPYLISFKTYETTSRLRGKKARPEFKTKESQLTAFGKNLKILEEETY